MHTRMGGAVALFLLLAGCAHAPAPAPRIHHETKGTPPPPRVKLTVMTIESDPFAKLARAVNEQLAAVKLTGVDDVVVSKVTLEVVQLSIECVDASNSCFAAVGKSLNADRILVAQLVGGTRRRDHSVKVALTLFDVGSEQPTRVVDQSWKNEDEAIAGLDGLIQKLSTGAEGDAPVKDAS